MREQILEVSILSLLTLIINAILHTKADDYEDN